jgi:hypothetical protein
VTRERIQQEKQNAAGSLPHAQSRNSSEYLGYHAQTENPERF